MMTSVKRAVVIMISKSHMVSNSTRDIPDSTPIKKTSSTIRSSTPLEQAMLLLSMEGYSISSQVLIQTVERTIFTNSTLRQNNGIKYSKQLVITTLTTK